MKKYIPLLSSLLIAPFSVSTSTAATFDFVAYAAGAEAGHNPLIKTEAGITLNATGDHTTDGGATWTSAFAYLDDLSGTSPAGLGVCKVITGSAQCNPGNDDNVTRDEKVTLSFDQVVTFNTINLYNGEHKEIFDGTFKLRIDSGAWATHALNTLISINFTGTNFEFWNNNVTESHDRQFYFGDIDVEAPSAVPVPAAVWLFGSALFGLGSLKRNKKATIA